MRKHMITRKFEQNTLSVLVANLQDKSVESMQITTGRLPKEDVLKFVKSKFDTIDMKVVEIEYIQKDLITVGMTEEDFIIHGEVLVK